MHKIHIKKSAGLSKAAPAGENHHYHYLSQLLCWPKNNTAYFKTYWQPIFWCSEAMVRIVVLYSWAKHLTCSLHCDLFKHHGI